MAVLGVVNAHTIKSDWLKQPINWLFFIVLTKYAFTVYLLSVDFSIAVLPRNF